MRFQMVTEFITPQAHYYEYTNQIFICHYFHTKHYRSNNNNNNNNNVLPLYLPVRYDNNNNNANKVKIVILKLLLTDNNNNGKKCITVEFKWNTF